MELRLREEGLSWREIDGELVAVDLATSQYLGANPAGLALWRSLAAGAEREKLVAQLVDTYGIDPARAGADVDRFIGEVEAAALLER
jgi:hypothetical protein